MNLLSTRLTWAMDKKSDLDGFRIRAADVARAAKVSEASVGYWLADINGISATKARLVGEYLNINPIWLETGKGEPDFGGSTRAQRKDSQSSPVHPEHIQAVIDLMYSVDERGMRKIRDAAEDALDRYRMMQNQLGIEIKPTARPTASKAHTPQSPSNFEGSYQDFGNASIGAVAGRDIVKLNNEQKK